MTVVNHSIVHLTMRFGDTVLSTGTGFLYCHQDKFYIVTAWHNVTGLHSETLDCLSDKASIPDNIVANIAVAYPNVAVVKHAVVLPLYKDNQATFLIHPDNWPRVDVVAIPFDPNAEHDVELWFSHQPGLAKRKWLIMQPHADGTQAQLVPMQHHQFRDERIVQQWFDTVSVTEELFIPGYPQNISDSGLQPIWKRATLASSMQRGFGGEPKYLVDTASKSGMSGAPVVYYSPTGKISMRGYQSMVSKEVMILAGVYVGRMGISSSEDPQLGIVWNRSVINQIIEGGCFEKESVDIKANEQVITEMARLLLKDAGDDRIQLLKNSETLTRSVVLNNLMKSLNGRTSITVAKRIILQVVDERLVG